MLDTNCPTIKIFLKKPCKITGGGDSIAVMNVRDSMKNEAYVLEGPPMTSGDFPYDAHAIPKQANHNYGHWTFRVLLSGKFAVEQLDRTAMRWRRIAESKWSDAMKEADFLNCI